MRFLNWMGEHPILTFVIVCVVFSGIVEIIKACRGDKTDE